MTVDKERLDELHLYLENAVDQLVRSQRVARGVDAVADLEARVDRALGDLVALRNDVRDALLRAAARGPKKLPIVRD
ncbi:MAG: hypothetical protein D6689_13490 [Deltaproteobacteria bacterium]|nr:MAG: hypothetical protein D6689_13490 [Deltaproteobacteria bacterium]